MTTYIFLDTNILDKQFRLNTDVEELLRFKSVTKQQVKVILFEIVFKELKDHADSQLDKYNENVKSINSLRSWMSWEPVREVEKENILSKYEEILKQLFTFYEPDDIVYKRVFDRYFQHLKPFDGNKQEFKDGLLWESIMNFKFKNFKTDNKYILITNNTGDFSLNKQNGEILHPHYRKEFPSLELFNGIKSFLDSEGYYNNFHLEKEKRKELLQVIETSLQTHRWEFEEPLHEYIFQINSLSSEEYALRGSEIEGVTNGDIAQVYESDKYLHVPIVLTSRINLSKRIHNPQLISFNEEDEYKEINKIAMIKCEAIFPKNNFTEVYFDKIRYQSH